MPHANPSSEQAATTRLFRSAAVASAALWLATGAPLAAAATMTRDAGSGALGVGAVAFPDPALSVRYQTSAAQAFHVTVRYGDDAAAATADVQALLVPPFGQTAASRLAFYGGIGVGGESRRGEEPVERYVLRLPVGAQVDVPALHVATFLEGDGLVGPLPATRFAGSLLGGLRATW
jgi:hypothetical protein